MKKLLLALTITSMANVAFAEIVKEENASLHSKTTIASNASTGTPCALSTQRDSQGRWIYIQEEHK